MDGNAGYNQIFMALEDIRKTAFRVPGAVGLFEYLVMTFGLKNSGAMYQRAMNYIFHDLIGKLVEIYIDDVVVKSMSAGGHLEDLRKVLERTQKFGLKMNPKKCAFGVSSTSGGACWMQGSSGRLGMQNGSPAWSVYKRRMADGESAWISETSTEQRQRTNIRCQWPKH